MIQIEYGRHWLEAFTIVHLDVRFALDWSKKMFSNFHISSGLNETFMQGYLVLRF